MTKKDISSNILTDYDLWCLLLHAWFAVHRIRQIELAQFGLTVEQSGILDAARRRGGWVTSKELEDLSLRKHNSISDLISRMTKRGLIGKEKRPGEKRHRIFITQNGENLFSKSGVVSLNTILSFLSPEEKRQLASSLRSLNSEAHDLMGASFEPPFLTNNSRLTLTEIAEQTDTSHFRESDYELWRFLDRAAFAVHRLRQIELVQYEVTVEQAAILHILKENGGWMTTKELEDFTMRKHNSISTLVKRMVISGLVDKERRPGDNRNRILITEVGERLLGRVPTTSIEMVLSCLSTEEKLQLASNLQRVHIKARRLLGMPTNHLSLDGYDCHFQRSPWNKIHHKSL